MTDTGVDIAPGQVVSAGEQLAATADLASRAGTYLLTAGDGLTGTVQAGTSVGSAARAFGAACGSFCAQLVESANGLGVNLTQAAQLLLQVEGDAVNRFRPIAGRDPI